MSRESVLEDDPIYTVAELAKLAKCSLHTIYQAIYSGKLRAFMLNPGVGAARKNWRVYKSEWDHFSNRK